MRVTILPSADRDLDDVYAWIARENRGAAARVVRRITAAALALRDFPLRGTTRPEIGAGVRSIVSGKYLVLYRVGGDAVEIVRVLHGARDLGGAAEEWG
jgi:toxin ParE1/3/4